MVHAERIVRAEMENIDIEVKERKADNIIKGMMKTSSKIRSEELDHARSRIKAGGSVDEVMDDMTKALISKLLAKPINKLKEASRDGRTDYCEVVSEIFGVDEQ